jgi:hypothetical protein
MSHCSVSYIQAASSAVADVYVRRQPHSIERGSFGALVGVSQHGSHPLSPASSSSSSSASAASTTAPTALDALVARDYADPCAQLARFGSATAEEMVASRVNDSAPGLCLLQYVYVLNMFYWYLMFIVCVRFRFEKA